MQRRIIADVDFLSDKISSIPFPSWNEYFFYLSYTRCEICSCLQWVKTIFWKVLSDLNISKPLNVMFCYLNIKWVLTVSPIFHFSIVLLRGLIQLFHSWSNKWTYCRQCHVMLIECVFLSNDQYAMSMFAWNRKDFMQRSTGIMLTDMSQRLILITNGS